MVICPYPSNCEIEPVAIYIFMNTWYLKAKHHPYSHLEKLCWLLPKHFPVLPCIPAVFRYKKESHIV
ncbi:unknown [Bacteroides sp. CAG:144]|nr:unknown [Bacteroides sp. CAG:144]